MPDSRASPGSETTSEKPGAFPVTHWSVVLAAGQSTEDQASAALEQLCQTYWYPLYAYIRRRGHSLEDAQDLTQSYLLQLLERKSFARANPHRGRFRSYLLAGLNYFLVDEHARATAQKRGGGQPVLSFDAQTAADRYQMEAADDRSPDRLFDRCWAVTMLDQVLARLEQEYREADKAALFRRLQDFLVPGTNDETYNDAAADLNMTSEAVKKAVHRLRHRYYELFREEIAQTVADPTEGEDELRHLCAVMAE